MRIILKNGRVIWITGLSGSGKTTLAVAIQQALTQKKMPVALLDGDQLREVLLGSSQNQAQQFNSAKREELAFVYCRLAKLLSEQGLWVIVSTISMRQSVFDWNRNNLPNYFEILIDLPIETLRTRDPKNIYADYNQGHQKNVIGLDIVADKPSNPELVFSEVNLKSPEQMAELALKCIEDNT